MLPSLGKPLLALVVASKGKGCWWFGNGLGMVWEWFGCVRVLPCLFPPWSLVWSTTSSSAISSCCSGSMAFVMRLSTGLKSIEVLCVCVWVVSLSPLSHLASQLRLGVAVKVCLCLCPRFSSSVYCSSQRFSSPRFFATKGGGLNCRRLRCVLALVVARLCLYSTCG